MNTEALFLFLILLLGLVLCSFLGGNCGKEGYSNHHVKHHKNHHNNSSSHHHHTGSSYDNYNHYSGSSSPVVANGSTFYDASGNTATVATGSNGLQTISLNQVGSTTPTVFTQTSANSNTFNNSSPLLKGFSATIVQGSNGQTTIIFTLPNNSVQVFTQQPPTTTTSSQYYGSTGTPIQASPYNLAYSQPGYQGQSNYDLNFNAENSGGNGSNSGTGGYGNTYYSSLPQGVPASQIPPGQEDLYILKSEVVPPVCPACPVSSACPKTEKCPPCPACARCPEPSFECKKVPNYNAIDEAYLPEPVLNDFSQFGM